MGIPDLSISSIYVAIFILLQFIFTLRVAAVRRAEGVSLGHGNSSLLEQRMRAHGNFTEVVPITLIALILLDLNNTNTLLLHALGIAFLIFRVMHYIAVANATAIKYRFVGMLGTLLTMAAAAIVLILAIA